jgi:hypothetical protein
MHHRKGYAFLDGNASIHPSTNFYIFYENEQVGKGKGEHRNTTKMGGLVKNFYYQKTMF